MLPTLAQVVEYVTELAANNPSRLVEHVLACLALLFIASKAINLVLNFRPSALLNVIPGAKGMVERKIEGEVDKVIADRFAEYDTGGEAAITTFPKKGRKPKDVVKMLKKFRENDATGEGDLFAYSYHTNRKGFNEMLAQANELFLHSNGLNPMSFPTLRKCEVEVVAMALDMLHASETGVGVMTSGGTESVLCAMLAMRERARDLLPHITEPEIVLPVSAHPCFEKAGHFFGIKMVHVPYGKGYRVDIDKYASAITANTICLVASAPAYPQGVVDPIEEISAMAIEHNLPLHVDACIGGYMLPWVEKVGYEVPLWDFRVPGVTSISADVHKYGFASKGASTVLYRSREYRKYQFYGYTGWPGGLFISPGIMGTRPGGSIAAAWAAMVGLGQEGYLELAEELMDVSKRMQAGIANIDGITVFGEPHMNIVCFGPEEGSDINVHAVADVMEKEFGWTLERQQLPNCIHMSLMPSHAQYVDEILADLAVSVDTVRKNKELGDEGSAAMYGLVANIPDMSLVETFLNVFMDKVYDNPEASKARGAQ